jgi:hypothetical protein
VLVERLLQSSDPAIRRLAGDESADALESPKVRTLLRFPDVYPYKKWWGTHWRLIALADLGVPPGTPELAKGINQELEWLTSDEAAATKTNKVGLVLRHATIEGGAIYSASKLGFASDPRVRHLVNSLIQWQWPDGGWNCDERATGRRSSFHESATTALGLSAYHSATGDSDALTAARRTAELFLEHLLFRSLSTGEVIHPSWIKLHYPPYWHYDILQGLRVVQAVGLLADPRAADALEIVEKQRRRDGRFSGPSWSSTKVMQESDHPDPRGLRDAVSWGPGPNNEMLNLRAEHILAAALKVSA